jgi:hypothetical protein
VEWPFNDESQIGGKDMKAKDIKTQPAYRIIDDVPRVVIVGFKPDNLNDFEWDEFECTDTTEGKGGPDDTVFITRPSEEDSGKSEVGQMTIMSGKSVGLWTINEDGSLGDRLQREDELEVIRHPDQWTEWARMFQGEDELVLKAFHVSVTIATGEHITDDNVEEYMHDAMEDIVEKFGASATSYVVAEIGKVSTPHDRESEEESVWEHADSIVEGMDVLLQKRGFDNPKKAPGRTEFNGMTRLIEDIRTLLNNGVRNEIETKECPGLLDEIASAMRSFGYKVDGGE